jgi:hypothetical protein
MTPGNPSKSLTITLRINENVLKKMRENAEDRDISLNTLANQIFKRYVEWDSHQPKLGMIPIARPVVIQLFENISEDKIVDIATKVGRGVVKDIALFMKHSGNNKYSGNKPSKARRYSKSAFIHNKTRSGKELVTLP